MIKLNWKSRCVFFFWGGGGGGGGGGGKPKNMMKHLRKSATINTNLVAACIIILMIMICVDYRIVCNMQTATLVPETLKHFRMIFFPPLVAPPQLIESQAFQLGAQGMSVLPS